jgi:hypothetical protein
MADCFLAAAQRSDPTAPSSAVLRRRTFFSQRGLGKGVYYYPGKSMILSTKWAGKTEPQITQITQIF